MTSTSARALSASLDKLQITPPKVRSVKPPKAPIDSWEDEDEGDEPPSAQPLSSPVGDFPEAPPTSPASPSVRTKATSSGSPFQTFPPFGMNGSLETSADDEPLSQRREVADRRPEKTTAVASRLIAAGIGQKAPRRTQEQREYDQAIKMQEKKKRDAAKEEVEKAQKDKERAKAAIWED